MLARESRHDNLRDGRGEKRKRVLRYGHRKTIAGAFKPPPPPSPPSPPSSSSSSFFFFFFFFVFLLGWGGVGRGLGCFCFGHNKTDSCNVFSI